MPLSNWLDTDLLGSDLAGKRVIRFHGAILQKQNLWVGFFVFEQEGGRFSVLPVNAARQEVP
jgi:hypothetical protein